MRYLTARQPDQAASMQPVARLRMVAVLLLGIWLMGCSNQGPAVEPTPEASSGDVVELSPEAQQTAKLKIVEVAEQPLQNVLMATGAIDPDPSRLAHIRPLARGVAEKIWTQLGDRVKTGDPLITYDNIELGELIGEYRSLQAQIKQEEAQAEVAKSNLSRSESLLAAEAIAQKEHDFRKAQYGQAVAAVESKKAELAGVEEKIHRFGLTDDDLQNLDSTEHAPHRTASHGTLKAPFAGVITMQDVASGEMVEPDREIFTLADPSVVWVLADIYEKDLGQVAVGQACQVKVSSYPDHEFSGKITYISDVLDSASRTGKLRCVVSNADGRLKLEMFATVEIPLPQGRKVAVIPESAVQMVGDQSVVFVPKDSSHFEKRLV